MQSPVIPNPLSEQFILTCQHESCGSVRIINQIGSAGLTLGSIVPHSPADPDYGVCLRCRRYKMKVTGAPAPPPPPKPLGFTRIPTK